MRVFDILWDTDGEDVDLPDSIELPDGFGPDDQETISDYITDLTGYCHRGFRYEFTF